LKIAIDALNVKSIGGIAILPGIVNHLIENDATVSNVIIFHNELLNPFQSRKKIKFYRINHNSRILYLIWQSVFLKTLLKILKCSKLISFGGYYLGRFNNFSILFQNLIPLDNNSVEMFDYTKRIKLKLLKRFYLSSIIRSDKIYLLTNHSENYLKCIPKTDLEKKCSYLEFEVEVKKKAGVSYKVKILNEFYYILPLSHIIKIT